MRVNLGSGGSPMKGWVNLDIAAIPGVDVVHDLDDAPWPFTDNSVTQIEAKDVFEHVTDAILFMKECHRILGNGNLLHIRTPHYLSIDAFTDPTHKRFPTQYTFDYWVPGTVYHTAHNAAYGGVSFKKVDLFIGGGAVDVTLAKLP